MPPPAAGRRARRPFVGCGNVGPLGDHGVLVEILERAEGDQGDALLARHRERRELGLRQPGEGLFEGAEGFLQADGDGAAQVCGVWQRAHSRLLT